ncbi:hypothetical protein HCN_p06 (plasmid) [Helicobacter cinaedi PAGU611]|uniref:Periplasmic protein n=2 Tax=Helicobacter cinaedi TaxID=213 RepID=A0AAI8QGL6_9HELI|nr:hypothetical protein [Helicobacter cinaedi]QOQ91301.1 hypothetical protein HW260_02890 [Helicobacter cinaedi]QOQ95490.1 hypothetical protein HW245_07515 [Helicobacter cinaedi]BAM13245.1 hypothetical protein HCN_p06 [Helicobacter cinaedi PAGU611]BAM32786.1 hypothetical protein HCBAA847_1556 [Helicobacter cinaedi CCUG 18818 = ATCC BAA-847]
MKKIKIIILFMFVLCVTFSSAIEAITILKKADNLPYSYEKKVSMLKKLGFEYCVEQDKFSENSFWFFHITHKLQLRNNNHSFFYIENNDGFMQFKNFIKAHTQSNFMPRFYTCLDLYDSKEYQAEVERIVKKYCKDCQ